MRLPLLRLLNAFISSLRAKSYEREKEQKENIKETATIRTQN